jgi:hypothetical protein
VWRCAGFVVALSSTLRDGQTLPSADSRSPAPGYAAARSTLPSIPATCGVANAIGELRKLL